MRACGGGACAYVFALYKATVYNDVSRLAVETELLMCVHDQSGGRSERGHRLYARPARMQSSARDEANDNCGRANSQTYLEPDLPVGATDTNTGPTRGSTPQ